MPSGQARPPVHSRRQRVFPPEMLLSVQTTWGEPDAGAAHPAVVVHLGKQTPNQVFELVA